MQSFQVTQNGNNDCGSSPGYLTHIIVVEKPIKETIVSLSTFSTLGLLLQNVCVLLPESTLVTFCRQWQKEKKREIEMEGLVQEKQSENIRGMWHEGVQDRTKE